ncbi:winged helix DNA-binding domain-containing protein, partial [Atractiella rhizophila]
PTDPAKYYVLGQAEWYFSVDNLCKDMFLRGQMDSQGWVDISMVASFNRIKSLTDDMNLVRDTMSLSTFLEVRDWKVRKRGDWYHWILDTASPSKV